MIHHHKYVEHALRERERFAITVDVWEDIGLFVDSFEPACFKENPGVREVTRSIWKLYKKNCVSIKPICDTEPHLIVSLILIGLLGRSLCGCGSCISDNMEERGNI
jgi:hypothetical protein